MTNRLHSTPILDLSKYDTLVADALAAFEQDVMYAVQVVESARSISGKKSSASKKRSQ